MNDETTGPPNHPNLSLPKDVENMKTEAFSGGLYRQNLITEILRTNICKYKTITFNSDM